MFLRALSLDVGGVTESTKMARSFFFSASCYGLKYIPHFASLRTPHEHIPLQNRMTLGMAGDDMKLWASQVQL